MRISIAERFWNKVDKTGSCWIWTASRNEGYGMFWDGKLNQRAHRMAYQWMNGLIPEGLTIDHMCRVRSCVNPSHLRVLTNVENARDAAKFIDLSGQTFGRLRVEKHVGRSKHRHSLWQCRCSCGKTIVVCKVVLKNGHCRSCGCLKRDLLGALKK